MLKENTSCSGRCYSAPSSGPRCLTLEPVWNEGPQCVNPSFPLANFKLLVIEQLANDSRWQKKCWMQTLRTTFSHVQYGDRLGLPYRVPCYNLMAIIWQNNTIICQHVKVNCEQI